MNNTNRALNRVFIFLIGVVTLVLGLAAASVNLVPFVRTGWEAVAPPIRDNLDGAYTASQMFATGTSWIGVGVLGVLAILVIVLLGFVLRQGRGRTTRLLREAPTKNGVIVIDSRVAEDVLNDAFAGRPELIGSHVSTFDVQGISTLKVSVTARRGVSPKDVAKMVERAVGGLDVVMGREIPTYVQINGGFRARKSSSTRLD